MSGAREPSTDVVGRSGGNSGADGTVRMEEGTRSALATGRLVPGCLFCVGGGHVDYMARAIKLAMRAKRICKPNPAVGAVIARDGQLLGEGFTQPAGHAHAEVMALRQAGNLARGASLYVTLEPCSHHGRTAPCVDAIIAAEVAQVHASMVDPSPWV